MDEAVKEEQAELDEIRKMRESSLTETPPSESEDDSVE